MSEITQPSPNLPLDPEYWGEINEDFVPNPANDISFLDYWKIELSGNYLANDSLFSFLKRGYEGFVLDDGIEFSPNRNTEPQQYYRPKTLLFYDVEHLALTSHQSKTQKRLRRANPLSVEELSSLNTDELFRMYLGERIEIDNPNWQGGNFNFQPHDYIAFVDAGETEYRYSRRVWFGMVTQTSKGKTLLEVVCDKHQDHGSRLLMIRKPDIPGVLVPFTVGRTDTIRDKKGDPRYIRRVKYLTVVSPGEIPRNKRPIKEIIGQLATNKGKARIRF